MIFLDTPYCTISHLVSLKLTMPAIARTRELADPVDVPHRVVRFHTLGAECGVLVVMMESDSPAQHAGVRLGDFPKS
jgi:hypothetical protein